MKDVEELFIQNVLTQRIRTISGEQTLKCCGDVGEREREVFAHVPIYVQANINSNFILNMKINCSRLKKMN